MNLFQRQILALKNSEPEIGTRRIAAELDTTRDKVRYAINKMRESGEWPIDQPVDAGLRDSCSRSFSGDSGMVEVNGERIRTVEDALEYAEIDLDEWQVDRCVINSYEVTMRGEAGPETRTNWQVKVWLKKKALDRDVAFLNAFQSIIDSYKPSNVELRPREDVRDMIAIVNMPDVHMGKYCWGEMTGTDYDLEKAAELAFHAIEDLAAECYERNVQSILFPIGNDYLHVDNLDKTTAKGTAQDVDDRIELIYEVGLETLIASIEQLSMVAPVEVIGIPGNHDTLSAKHLYISLYYIFKNNKNVTVDKTPAFRKARRYHDNGFLFYHGAKGEPRMQEVAPLFASEFSDIAASTRFWHCFLGHLHKQERHLVPVRNTEKNVTINRISALSGTDAWHYQAGYIKQARFAEVYFYDKHGYRGEEASRVIS